MSFPRGEARHRRVRLPVLLPALLACGGSLCAEPFLKARPVWPESRRLEKNLQVAFRAVIEDSGPGKTTLRLTASTVYRAAVNGGHAGYGPARGPHGYYRIDEIDIGPLLHRGRNVVAIEVAGYNVNSYYTLDQPSFLEAEVVRGGEVLAATGASGFQASILGERVQRTQRYSFQRPFSEVYRLRPDSGRWKTDPESPFPEARCAVDDRQLRHLDRVAPCPDFPVRSDPSVIASGTVLPLEKPGEPWKDRSLVAIGPRLKGYPEEDLETIPSLEMQKLSFRGDPVKPAAPLRSGEACVMEAGTYRILDFGENRTGFIGASVSCDVPTRLVLAFDEVLSSGDVDFKRLGCVNLAVYEIPAGRFRIETFEPYTLRYLKPMVLSGKCALQDVYIREYAGSGAQAGSFRSSDPRLEKLFEAGRSTYRQNAVDVFMDCPSRERAGWLCDSFFTARVAPDLCGNTSVESAMMENFLLPAKFEFLPDGMLPMCYPADHNDGVFIPNWAMWFVIQLEEYQERSGDRERVRALRDRVLKLLEYFKQFRNSDGLLERLPGWVFVEWSAANNYVQDVNYPSNMLYAGTLSAAARLYDLPDLALEADRIRETVRRQSFDGTFFVDNAVRKPDGTLQTTRNRTEVCQYFAVFFGVASAQSHPEFLKTLVEKFGPGREKKNLFGDVGPANSFIGNMLRIEILSRLGLSQQILDESIDYLLYMAERTGTLWENVGDYASCNHGFASHIVHTLLRDVLGARNVDRVGKKVEVVLEPLRLEWCEGSIPTPHGIVRLCWRKREGVLEYTLAAPEGYDVRVENKTGLQLEKKP